MYQDRAVSSTEVPPIEPVSSINQVTINTLVDANTALGVLLAKIRGNQPEQGNKLEKVPERHLMGDSRTLQSLAGDIFTKTQELHRLIGHDK